MYMVKSFTQSKRATTHRKGKAQMFYTRPTYRAFRGPIDTTNAHRHQKAHGFAVDSTWCVRENCTPAAGTIIQPLDGSKAIWPK